MPRLLEENDLDRASLEASTSSKLRGLTQDYKRISFMPLPHQSFIASEIINGAKKQLK
jgi:hypothetical protein